MKEAALRGLPLSAAFFLHRKKIGKQRLSKIRQASNQLAHFPYVFQNALRKRILYRLGIFLREFRLQPTGIAVLIEQCRQRNVQSRSYFVDCLRARKTLPCFHVAYICSAHPDGLRQFFLRQTCLLSVKFHVLNKNVPNTHESIF